MKSFRIATASSRRRTWRVPDACASRFVDASASLEFLGAPLSLPLGPARSTKGSDDQTVKEDGVNHAGIGRIKRPSLYRIYLTVGAAFVLAYFAMPTPTAHALFRIPMDLLPIAATVLAIRKYQPKPAFPWRILLAAEVIYVIADSVWAYYHVADARHIPYPNVADASYLSAYCVLGAALWLLIRSRTPKMDTSALIDAAIFVMGAGILSWTLFIGAFADDLSLPFLNKFVSMAFPLLDLVLLVFVCRLFLGGAARNRSLKILGIAVASMLVADTAYASLSLMGRYEIGNVLDLGWMLMAILLGAAALHPDMKTAMAPDPQQSDLPSLRRVWLPGSALLLLPVSAILQQELRDHHVEVGALSLVGSAMLILVTTRMSMLMKDLRSKIAELRHERRTLQGSLKDREVLARQLSHQALHDALTDLPNRALFFDRIKVALRGPRGRSGGSAVLFIDVDDFKLVNDRFGHGVADELLVHLGKRLSESLRGYDSAARLGGDEFGVLLVDVEREEDAVAAAERIRRVLDGRFEVGGHPIDVSFSIGVAFCDGCLDGVEEIVRRADIAMYSVKRTGKNGMASFRPEMTAILFEYLELKDEIATALIERQFSVVYQPIVSLADRRVLGVEALVRWNHPHRGLVSPADFIPAAEEAGLIAGIDRYVIAEAARRVSDLTALPGAEQLALFVNVSPALLCAPGFTEFVRRTLTESELPPSSLTIEITERTLAEDTETVTSVLKELRALCVQVAIDDFGTGYSSLAYIKRFPLNILKVDKSFIDNIATDAQGAALVRTIIGLGEALGLAVVGEGVEEEAQAQALAGMGCERAQGYLFAPPLHASDLEELLAHKAASREGTSMMPARNLLVTASSFE